MTLIVEDGAGLSTAESYISVAEFKTYADAHGFDYSAYDDTDDIEPALRRATTWLDARYGVRFAGYRVAAGQALILPQNGLLDRGGYAIAANSIPARVKQATAEAAWRELQAPGSLSPDVVPGKVKKRVKVDTVEVEYAVGSGGAANQTPVISIIDGILAPLLGAPASPCFGTAVRA